MNKISVCTITSSVELSMLLSSYSALLEQTYTEWEWVICDSGSNKEIVTTLESLSKADKRVKTYFYKEGKNRSLMKNHCIDNSTGDYLVELGYGDRLTNDALFEVTRTFDDNPDIGMVYSNFTKVDDNGKCHQYNSPGWNHKTCEYKDDRYLEVITPDIYGTSKHLPLPNVQYWELVPKYLIAFRRHVLDDIGGYDDTLAYGEGYNIVLMLHSYSKIKHIDKMLYLYRVECNAWEDDKNRDAQIELSAAKELSDIRDKYFNDIRLDVGCGPNKALGYQGIDAVPLSAFIYFANYGLQEFEESSVTTIRTVDFIEHIQDKIWTLEQFYRVLIPGGTVYIQVPSTDGRGAFQDPTHVSFWNENSFKDMYMNGDHRYDHNFKFTVNYCHTTEKDKDGVCWVRVLLTAIK